VLEPGKSLRRSSRPDSGPGVFADDRSSRHRYRTIIRSGELAERRYVSSASTTRAVRCADTTDSAQHTPRSCGQRLRKCRSRA